jgi:hypothetical protein
LEWYGVEYDPSWTALELEETLKDAMSQVPRPKLNPEWSDVEEELRGQYSEGGTQTRNEYVSSTSSAPTRAHFAFLDFRVLTREHESIRLNNFLLKDPQGFYNTYFASKPLNHVMVMRGMPDGCRLGVVCTAADELRLKVVDVLCAPTNGGRRTWGGKEEIYDIVLGRDMETVDAAARELEEEHGTGGAIPRFGMW